MAVFLMITIRHSENNLISDLKLLLYLSKLKNSSQHFEEKRHRNRETSEAICKAFCINHTNHTIAIYCFFWSI